MTNRFKNRHQNTIPKKILPPDAVRITKEDKTRVWLIGGREFDSKAEYFQYLMDKALAEKSEVKVTVDEGEQVAVMSTKQDATGATDETKITAKPVKITPTTVD